MMPYQQCALRSKDALIKENEEWGWSEHSATRLSNSVIRESKHDL